MKNIFLLISISLLFSCAHHDEKIKFNLRLNEAKENIGKGLGLDLVIVDSRSDETLGEKIFSADEKIKITSEENLAESLQKKISENLLQKGFKKGWDKTLEIEIINLDYRAKREFFVGKSDAKISLKVVINNNKNSASFTKNFDSSVNSYHFIAPLESTDAATINSLIGEVVNGILSDREILNKLAQ
jgi:uncharacterized lipoprotein YajG